MGIGFGAVAGLFKSGAEASIWCFFGVFAPLNTPD